MNIQRQWNTNTQEVNRLLQDVAADLTLSETDRRSKQIAMKAARFIALLNGKSDEEVIEMVKVAARNFKSVTITSTSNVQIL